MRIFGTLVGVPQALPTWRSGWRRAAGAMVGMGLLASVALSQTQGPPTVTSSGLNTRVTPSVTGAVTTYSITGGTRPGNGPNLFHSFGFFDLPNAGDIANFQNETGRPTTNILARVTESQPSAIFGTIRTTDFGSANLFLINPSGWIFGPTAALDVRGSFHVSSANDVLLSDGARFNAAPGPADALLTIAPPAAFGFLGPAGPISIQGSALSVERGKTLSIVGGDVAIQGATLTAPGGRIQIGSFTAKGDATVDGLDGGFASLGRVEISGAASLSAAGDVRLDGNGNPSVVNGGTVLIRGGQVDILGASIDASGAQALDADGNPLAGTAGGTVVIRGGRLFVDGSSSGSSMMVQTYGNEPGAQVGIDIHMDELIRLTNGTSLQSTTSGNARGGDIQVVAGGTAGVPGMITFETGSSLLSVTTGRGRGGDIRLAAGSVTIDSGGIATLSQFGDGVGGDVTLTGGVVALTGGAVIQSINQNTTLEGRGGNITLRAGDSVLISGQDASGSASQLVSSTDTGGDGGRILIKAESLTMQSGTAITSSASFNAEGPGGTGGAIVIDVGRLSLTGGATINSTTAAPMAAGSIMVTATGEAEISGTNGGIFSIAFGAPAGDINVQAGTLRLTDRSLIQSGIFIPGESPGQGGNVTVGASDSILIAEGAGISSQAVTLPVGRVAVSSRSLTIDRGFINAGTLDVGRAGDISIDVGTLTISGGGQIASSSGFTASGAGGAVTVTASGPVAISGPAPGGESVLPEPFRGFVQDTSSGIFSTASSSDPMAGSAGSIAVSASALRLTDGGKISVESTGVGSAGNISLRLGTLSLSGGGGLFSNASSSGPGGNINVQAGHVHLASGATISASSSATGLAGSVTIQATTFQGQDSFVTTAAREADGGDIDILVGSLVFLRESEITTSVGKGAGKGGNITIDPQFVVLNNSQIRADAFGGPGGNITIVADVFFTSGSIVSASSALSAPGTINVEARFTNVGGALVQLPGDVLQAASLLRASCTARNAQGKASSLVVAGREGVPPDPEGLLWSPLGASLADLNLTLGEEHQWDRFPQFAGEWLDSNCAR